MSSKLTDLVELNVGGQLYTVSRPVLTAGGERCRLTDWFKLDKADGELARDTAGRVFIDRDGALFASVLDILRALREHTVAAGRLNKAKQPAATANGALPGGNGGLDVDALLPDGGGQTRRLRNECRYYGLEQVLKTPPAHRDSDAQSMADGYAPPTGEAKAGGFITIGYHGTFSFGRQVRHNKGMASDVSFRKISRILVCGRVALAREVFADTLNESRDPDRGNGTPGQADARYTQRYFLKHNVLELAFDACAAAGFRLVAVCGTGTNGPSSLDTKSSVGVPSEEDRWAHYNQFIFQR